MSLLALLLAAAAMAPPPGGQAAGGTEPARRLALVIGANHGGPGRQPLRYAVSDARAMIRVLEELGGVAADDSRLLVEPDRETLLWELDRLQERCRRLRPQCRRLETLVYYSGHSDEDGLLLGREVIAYRELRAQLESLSADVRIAVLDSCASGAFLRAKGGRARTAFLLDQASDLKGLAVMTSSSADEVSQESERIRGSFFTHHLIAGLRGAADATADGRITLGEAYQYAFNETLRQTATSTGGAQHASYDIRLSGTGDVVLTEVRRSEAVLRLDGGLAGRLYLHDRNGALVMELQKRPGAPVELAVNRGRYRLIIVTEGDIRETSVEVGPGETREIAAGQLRRTEIVDAIARGDQRAGRRPPGYRTAHFFVGFYSRASRYEGRWSFMPGMQLGVATSPVLSFGLVGYGRTAAEMNSRPPFWGLACDFLLLGRGRAGLRTRTVAGLMYRNREEELARRLTLVLEPGIGVTWRVGTRSRLVAHLSLDFVDGSNDSLRRYSCGLGVEIGRN